MGKEGKSGGFLTPKAIANRIKAKGLQKLRWYCQMCQKQCRDEVGALYSCTATGVGYILTLPLIPILYCTNIIYDWDVQRTYV